MNIPTYPGYESSELPSKTQRIADADRLREMGAAIVIGVAGSEESTIRFLLETLNAEITISSIETAKNDYVIGPYVTCVDSGDPFIPNGLCLWKMPRSET